MKEYKVDLHVHTVLSPCADLLMTPANIIEKALANNTAVMAVTDHNSAKNVRVMMELAESTSLHIIPGMEVESKEEVHLLCLFNNLEVLLDWQQVVYHSLPDTNNDEEIFGPQIITDFNDKFVEKENRLLATATDMNIEEIVTEVRKRDGLVIPSHVDRTLGLINNLGLIPPDLDLSILEIYRETEIKEFKEQYSFLNDYSFIKNSDSHYLDELKPRMQLKLDGVSLDEIVTAVKKDRKLFL